MDFIGEYGEEKKSKYNAALSQLYRIDALWQSAHYKRRSGNLIGSNNDLDCIWSELGGDVNDKKIIEEWDKISELIIKYVKKKCTLARILLQKEIWLRKIQNNQGKGTAYIDPHDDDLEE